MRREKGKSSKGDKGEGAQALKAAGVLVSRSFRPPLAMGGMLQGKGG